ncbi:DUF4381 family protein [Aliagarivorans marinus]|uniref:DUF4381 family protein n=1 Tax=Aliagarivorans marinus TaxID=561965 RepID=UPI0004285D28|nr:DUF4381 family protein [Aliagarivorans marinus]
MPESVHQGSVTQFATHLIKQLQWIEEPDAISFVPATPAWALLFGMVIVALLLWRGWKHYRWLQRTYLRQGYGLVELAIHNHDLQQIAAITKRVAIQHWGERRIATMNAAQFHHFLTEKQGTAAIDLASITLIFELAYQSDAALESQHLEQILIWMEQL